MISNRLLLIVCVGLTAIEAVAQNALDVEKGQLRYWGRSFALWGMEAEDWPRLADDPTALRDALEPWAYSGVSAVGYALAGPGGKDPFFTAEGEPHAEAARRFGTFARLIRDYHLASAVSVFSSERGQWLASPDAYRKAAQAAARALPDKHSVIFVVGDLFATGAWPTDCPFALNEPAHAIALCRLIKEANPESLVGVPALLIRSPNALRPERTLLYAARSADGLERLIREAASGGAIDKSLADVVAVRADRFFLLRDAGASGSAAQRSFLSRVDQERLAATPRYIARSVMPRKDLVTIEEKSTGWRPLFDGLSLNGWTTLHPGWDGWTVEDGCIKCTGSNGQWLRTRRRYGSFILRFDYKIGKNGNSGVFVWAPLTGRASRFGMEMQIRGVQKTTLDEDTTGAIYDALPPTEDASRPPGEWNEVEIACRGSQVTVRINGRVVQDFDADKAPKLQRRRRQGVIGLQDHGDEVWFRRIRLKELAE